MAHLDDLVRYQRVGPELFLNFPLQAGLERFSGLALPTGKLPQAFQVHTAGSSGDEERVASLDDGRRYDNMWAHGAHRAARSLSGLYG
jgi:hypothetical protein